jgi:hypothetical protein
MKKDISTRKSLDQIKRESGRTFWGRLLAEESKEKKANEKPKCSEQVKP